MSNDNCINGLIEWKRHMEGVKAELVEEMSCHLKDLLDKAVAEAIRSNKRDQASVLSSKKDHVNNNKRHQGSISEKQKVFMHRASLLKLFLDLDLLFYTFGQLSTVVWSWLCLFMYTLLVPYRALHVLGSMYSESSHPLLLSGLVGGQLLVCQISVLGVLPIYVVTQYKLPPASSFIVILEQVRFLMKSYSFLRECTPLVLRKESITPCIKWNFVAKNFAQFLGCLFFGYYLLFTLCIPVFTNMSKQPFSTKTLVLSIFHATLPGTFVLLLSFFAFLHCWLNAFAEMLRFADRMFYKDWWNSTSFSNYYRTWNVVVHDWLYYYVYRDLLSLCKQWYRAGVMLTVFLISASVHEYVFTLSLRYFYPVMFCFFAIFGVLFNFMINDKRKSPVWNVMVWTFLFIGQGIQLCLYCQEWYAHIHCPLTEKTFWGLVTPRSWSCRS
ncbi:hypothetical protein XELAEV_18013602mg [Xenopus laevis]|uniref:O-acyltransferase n=1 Tax=Xenopus laevis TaxID=8355 RepID=A0A974HZI1_XENLA|nr:hypothetical protein XELAEV_18013602mg [Xenopus laevis]